MDLQDADIQTFLGLGLSSSEARVFVALYKLGTAEASRIAKASAVARPDVYRALSNLHKLGLVEKIIAHPFRFRAVPIETVVALYDKKEVYIYVIPTADMTESPALWSNNPSLVAMAEEYFETLWNTAQN